MFRKFKFEQEFYDNLRCIPFAVRHKLDLTGVKLSMKIWNRFSDDERRKLCEMDAEGPEATRYRELLVSLLQKLGEPAKFLEPAQLEQEKIQWANPNQIPEDIVAKTSQLGLAIQLEDWKNLDNLQRFVLFKLSQGKHDHLNLAPALKEFLDFKSL